MKWFLMWDEDSVGTFTNLGFQDDSTGESFPLGRGQEFPWAPLWPGQDLNISLAQGRGIPPTRELSSLLTQSLLWKIQCPTQATPAGQAQRHRSRLGPA